MIVCSKSIMVMYTFANVCAFRMSPSRIRFFKNALSKASQHNRLLLPNVWMSSTSTPTSLSESYTILDDPEENATTSQYHYETNRNLQNILQTAEKAAYEAGKIMNQTSGKIAVKDTKTNLADLVTESDYECQRVIKEVITRDCPNDYFLGEEDVEPGSFASSAALEKALKMSSKSSDDSPDNASSDGDEVDERFLFVVDPIDGTTNFQAGLPMFCVSIGIVALKENVEPQVVAGVIYNPVLNEMMSAVRGRGCYLNGNRLESSRRNVSALPSSSQRRKDEDNPKEEGISLNKAMINVGFPVYSEGTLRVSSKTVTALATKVRGLRMIASASQVMSWVAQGKLNAYVSWDLNAWDIAAGMIIVEECGGFISDFEGQRASILTRDMIISCNEGNGKHDLSKSILKIMEENDCLDYQ